MSRVRTWLRTVQRLVTPWTRPVRTSSRTGPEHSKMPYGWKRELCKKVKPRIATCAASQARLSFDVDLGLCFNSGKVPVFQLLQNADLAVLVSEVTVPAGERLEVHVLKLLHLPVEAIGILCL